MNRIDDNWITIQMLRIFHDYVQSHSMQLTAERFDTHQPLVFRRIKSLERAFGVSFFQRSGRSARVTQEGEIFDELIAPLLDNWTRICEEFSERRHELIAFSFAAPQSFLLNKLPQILARFRQDKHYAKFKTVSPGLEQTFELIENGTVDFGITLRPRRSGLVAERLFPYRRFLAVPKKWKLPEKITITDIATMFLIMPSDRGNARRALEAEFRKCKLPYKHNIVMDAQSVEVALKFVELEHGATVLPGYCYEEFSKRKKIRLIDLHDVLPDGEGYLVMQAGMETNKPMARFIDIVRDEAKKWYEQSLFDQGSTN